MEPIKNIATFPKGITNPLPPSKFLEMISGLKEEWGSGNINFRVFHSGNLVGVSVRFPGPVRHAISFDLANGWDSSSGHFGGLQTHWSLFPQHFREWWAARQKSSQNGA